MELFQCDNAPKIIKEKLSAQVLHLLFRNYQSNCIQMLFRKIRTPYWFCWSIPEFDRKSFLTERKRRNEHAIDHKSLTTISYFRKVIPQYSILRIGLRDGS